MSDYSHAEAYVKWKESIEFASVAGYTEPMMRFEHDTRVCPHCGSVVQLLSVKTHEDWHIAISYVASQASYADAMTRPLGG